MKAEDLRLNNWVEIKDQDVKTYAQVEGIGNLQHVAGQLWSIEELEPIPLTEEWLPMLGFEINQNGYYQKGDYKISDQMEFYFFDVGDWQMTIKYVHQLQNLYFALTGEELTIKE